MQQRHTCVHRVLLLLCVTAAGCFALQNDATELWHTDPQLQVREPVPGNTTLNRARDGGRRPGAGPVLDQSQVGCRELRSTRYISDGRCTSLSPVKELVCAGECLPARMQPNWIAGGYGGRYWGGRRAGQEWRCVTGHTRTQRIQLQCQDGSSRAYKITVVTSCRCKKYSRQHNQSEPGPRGRKAKRKQRRRDWRDAGPGRRTLRVGEE